MRPARAQSHAELQQAARTGIDPHLMKAEIARERGGRGGNGKSFATTLEQHDHVCRFSMSRGIRTMPNTSPTKAWYCSSPSPKRRCSRRARTLGTLC